jgi:hypothetical protein
LLQTFTNQPINLYRVTSNQLFEVLAKRSPQHNSKCNFAKFLQQGLHTFYRPKNGDGAVQAIFMVARVCLRCITGMNEI